MKNEKEYLDDIKKIRTIMERSSNFISLSGLSGILVGIYALIGSFIAYQILYINGIHLDGFIINKDSIIIKLGVLAVVLLLLAVGTGLYLTVKKSGQNPWDIKDPGYRNLAEHLLVPLVSGGLFIIVLVMRGYFGIVAPAFLIFYGLALVNGSKYTMHDIKYLGITEVVLGLICAALPGYGLLFWAFGFGVMHILYGTLMYIKYER